MGARPDTWMPLYCGDYLRDTMHLRAEGHGAYLLLIMAYWTSGGPLPDDDDYLSGVVRLDAKAWKRLRPTLQNFFEVDGEGWHHHRIEEEIAKANRISEMRQQAGKRGGNAKANSLANAKQTPTPSPSPSPSKKENTHTRARDEVEKAFDNYNLIAEQCKLPRAVSLTEDRRERVRAILRQHSLRQWNCALENLLNSDYCQGKKPNGHKVDFEFLCKPLNFIRLLEGGYNDGEFFDASTDRETAGDSGGGEFRA